jgi:N-acetyl-gamma-glutamyl-phosphate reductase
MKLQTAIVGASGYAGMELTRLLQRHPRVIAPVLFRRESQKVADSGASQSWPANGNFTMEVFSVSRLKEKGVAMVFLATPHDFSRSIVPEILEQGIRVVDLSGAWRLRESENRSVYGFDDPDVKAANEVMGRAVYGLPELWKSEIAPAAVVANPGCYATSVILGLAPLVQAELVDRERGVISDSKSGVSGAGKEPSARTHFVAVADNLSAYSVFRHRHLGEMVEQLGLTRNELTFTPHLLPIPRGILSTIYVHLPRSMTNGEIEACYRGFYAGRKWVRIFTPPALPEIQHSLHSNFCDIGFCLADDGRRLVVVSCVDNLLKGAAGQAVQNMNVMYGWDEGEGLQ